MGVGIVTMNLVKQYKSNLSKLPPHFLLRSKLYDAPKILLLSQS